MAETGTRRQARGLVVAWLLFTVLAVATGVYLLKKPAAEYRVAEVFTAAEEAIARDDWPAARERLEECLELAPRHSRARIYYGQLLREEGETGRALDVWRSIREGAAADQATARFLEATVAIERGRVDLSRDLLLEAIRLDPESLPAREKLLLVSRMLRDPVRIREQVERIAEHRPLSLDELIYRTIPHDSGFPADESIRVLEQTLSASPGDRDCQAAYLAALREAGATDKLLRVLTTRPDPSRTMDPAFAQRILALLELSRTREALRDCSNRKSEPSPAGCYACGRVAYENGQNALAAEFLGKSVQQDADHREALYVLGLALQGLGETASATEFISRSVQLDNLQRLCIRVTQGGTSRSEQARQLFLQIATTLEKLDRFSEAADWYEQALRLAPADRQLRERFLAARATGRVPRLPRKKLPARSLPREEFKTEASDRVPAEIAPSYTGRMRLVDVHDAAGIDFQYFNGETGFFHLIESMGGGAVVIDYDSDGWPDVYFPQGCRLPFKPGSWEHRDRLYRNLGNGRFADVTLSAGLGSNRYGLGGIAWDYDNDGDDDLFLSNFGRNEFYRNNGDGSFTEAGVELNLLDEEMTTSVAAADFNNDGSLDIYLANYVTELKTCRRPDGRYAPCDPANFEGQRDRLLISDGAGGFLDVSKESGILRTLVAGKGLGVVSADFDADGRMDVFVANDGDPNFLFWNRSGSESASPVFEERGIVSGAALDENGRAQAGMGIAVADLDGDSRLDLFVTNFYLEHNAFYRNLGGMQFVDDTRSAGLHRPTLATLGFGTQAVDLDADGDRDLFLANGHISRDPTGQQPWKMPAQLFENRGNGTFSEVSEISGPYFQSRALGRGVSTLDWNRDGRPDVVVVHQDRPVALLENQSDTGGRLHIPLRLVGVQANREGVGAAVRVKAGTTEQLLHRHSDGGYLGSNEKLLYATADRSAAEASVQVDWPSGRSTTHRLVMSEEVKRRTMREWVLTEDGGTYRNALGGLRN